MADKIKVAAAVVRRNGKILLTSRPADKPPMGLEFPGGKVDKNETLSQALKRELQEELGVDAIIFDPIYLTADDRLELFFIRAFIPETEEIKCCEKQQYFWVDPQNAAEVKELFDRIPLLPNDEKFWRFLCS